MLFDTRTVRKCGLQLIDTVGDADDTRLYTIYLPVGIIYLSVGAGGVWSERLTDIDGLTTLVTLQLVDTLVPYALKQGYEHGADTQLQSSFSSSAVTRVPPPPPTHGNGPLAV